DADEAVRRTAGFDAAALQVFELVADDGNPPDPVGRADSASSGVVSGEIALDAGRAADRNAAGVAVVLVRQDAETADIAALDHAAGLLTARGARTSHAAVVARQLGKVCLVGCSTLHIDLARRRIRIGEREFAEGESLTLDANTGLVYAGALQVRARVPHDLIARLEALRARVAAREQDCH
ncbi:PEP-utilizing enzyme, partial [Thiomonas sp.]